MTEELSKHVSKKVQCIFFNLLHICCYSDLLVILFAIYLMG